MSCYEDGLLPHINAGDMVLLLDNFYGSHMPEVFCERFMDELEAQGLGGQAQTILDAALPENALDGDKQERATWAWEDIESYFVYDGEFYLYFEPYNQCLWAVRQGIELPEEC